MSKNIEIYLKKMCQKISNKDVRESSYEEIRSHLLDKIEERVHEGLSHQDAEREVLATATNPKRLGKKLNISHRPFLLRYPFVMLSAASIAMSLVALVVGSNYLISNHLKPIVYNEADEAKFLKRFKGDLQVLAKYEKSGTRDRNGHDYIRQYVTLSSDDSPIEIKEIDKKFQGWLNSQKQMVSLSQSKLLYSIDLNWFNGLKRFDHWNYFSEKETKQNFFSGSVDKRLKISRDSVLSLRFTITVFTHWVKPINSAIKIRIKNLTCVKNIFLGGFYGFFQSDAV